VLDLLEFAVHLCELVCEGGLWCAAVVQDVAVALLIVLIVAITIIIQIITIHIITIPIILLLLIQLTPQLFISQIKIINYLL